jgi:hypothetical protein
MLRGGRKLVQKKRELHLHLSQHCDAFRPVQRDAVPAFAWEPGRSVWDGLRRERREQRTRLELRTLRRMGRCC